ncbi:MAG: ZIP family metal transporter [Clostridia bacterium]|nr:ZIP family metal transporter [Clostridia bacterium]
MKDVVIGLSVPFIGTALGSACVFLMKKDLSLRVRRALTGFSAGIMVTASVWSLIIPAIERSARLGRLSFLPALIGFWGGVLFLKLIDRLVPLFEAEDAGKKGGVKGLTMMVFAVTLHNVPEGMAVGVIYAGLIGGSADITAGGAFALALGIAIQNFPEGAIISMPLRADGKSKLRSFSYGALSGAVEPVFGALTVIAAEAVTPAMPYLLSFAAGAMICVVVEELIPEMSAGGRSNTGVMWFAFGFTLMMALDVALG